MGAKIIRRKSAKASSERTPSRPPPSAPSSTSSSWGADNEEKDAPQLISELREHVEQGRIFAARSVVRRLRDDGDNARKVPEDVLDDNVRHMMDEVIDQSDHVESLLRELHSDDGWTLAKERAGVTVHFRREEDSPIHTVRAATTFDDFSPTDFVRLCSLFVETEIMHLWFPGGVMRPASLLSWHSKYSKVIQLRINIGIPMISGRDAIVLGCGYHLPDRNAFLISTKTILEDTCRHCEIPKPAKGVVRMATDSIFYMELVKNDAISFKMIGRDDLKLKYMPSTVLNYLSQGHLPFDLMKTIHRTIRNFEGSRWEKKIEERGEFYAEIEEKVHEQLRKWDVDGTGGGGSPRGRPDDGGREIAHDGLGMKPSNTTYNADGGGEDGGRAWRWWALAIAVALSALFVHVVKFPRGLPMLVDMIVHGSLKSSVGEWPFLAMVTISGAGKSLAAIAGMASLVALAGARRLKKGHPYTDDRDPSIATVDGDSSEIESGGRSEGLLRSNVADHRTSGKKERAGLAPDRNDPLAKSPLSPNLRDVVSNLSDITSSPQPSPTSKSRRTELSSNRSTSSSKKSTRRVRSVLSNGVKGLKRRASLRSK